MTQISADSPPRAVLAPFGPRLGAFAIDALCWCGVNTFLWLLLTLTPGLSSPIDTILRMAGLFCWFALFWRLAQATPGKLALGLSIQPRGGPGRLSWWSILRRYAVQFLVPPLIASPFLHMPVPADPTLTTWILVLSSAMLGLGWVLLDCLWCLQGSAHQALHDKAAGTVVVRWVA